MYTTLPINVAEQIAIPKNQLTSATKKFLKEKLFIINSEYIIKERLGKPVYNVPKFFNLVDEQPPHLLLPRGFLSQLTQFLDSQRIAYRVTHHHPDFAPHSFASTVTLTDEQTQATQQAFRAGSGVIVAPPGSGKTVMGLELVALHQKPALILTHRKQLLDQWVEQIQTQLAIPKKHIGRYSSAYKKPGQHITVGLLQSFARMANLGPFAQQFGVIIVDECHHIPAKTFRKVVSRLNAPHLYGLTATPKRKHNDEPLIYLYLGEVVAKLEAKPTDAPFAVTIHQTTLTLPFAWKTDQSELLAKVLCYDTARNQQIVKDITQQLQQQRKTLVLSERKEHLKILELYLRDKCTVITFSGDDSAKQRAETMRRIKSNDYDVLLATGQLCGEGMHVPTIETLILAFPFSFEGKLAQYVGRLLHSQTPRQLIDYRDAGVEVLEEQFKKRRRYYKRSGLIQKNGGPLPLSLNK